MHFFQSPRICATANPKLPCTSLHHIADSLDIVRLIALSMIVYLDWADHRETGLPSPQTLLIEPPASKEPNNVATAAGDSSKDGTVLATQVSDLAAVEPVCISS